jgi:hypothetical protein
MEEQKVDLSSGGMVSVIMGKDYDIPIDFAHHPQCNFVEGWKLQPGQVNGTVIPTATKIVIMTDGLPSLVYHNLNSEFRRRNLPFVTRKSTNALNDALKEMFAKKAAPAGTPAPKPTGPGPKQIAPRGAIQELIKEANLLLSTGEESRRLFQVAKSRGIITTEASLAQAISKMRRTKGYGERPNSANPPELNQRLRALKILDDAIAGMQLVREYVEKTEAENSELTARILKMKEALA